MRSLVAVLALLGSFTACASPGPVRTDTDADHAAARSAVDDDDTATELADARLDLQLAELKAKHGAEDARHDVAVAHGELDTAEQALKLFDAETELEVGDAEIEVQRDEQRLLETKQELAELRAMYEADEFAKTTKELVLSRGESRVALTERELALTKARTLHRVAARAAERDEKLIAVEQARFAVKHATASQEEARLESEIELTRARRKITELEAKLAKAESGS